MHSEPSSPRRRRPRRWIAASCLVIAGILLAACSAVSAVPTGPGVDQGGSAASTTPSEAPSGTPTAGTALAVLATIPVKGKAPRTGYDRVADFGEAWLDVDHNRCDTRDDILARDLVDAVRQGSCKVTSGVLHDPYTGKTIDFVRGVQTSAAVQIDHVVALSNSWQTGAQKLTKRQRETLANDPLELVAVDGPTNQAKGDGDAATWLPPNRGYWCTYAAKQVSVKAAYHLWVTPAEHAALARILNGCPTQQAWASALAPTVGLG